MAFNAITKGKIIINPERAGIDKCPYIDLKNL